MPLTTLPTAPDINDPDTFEARAQAFVLALATLVSELNAIIGLTIPAGSAAAGALTGGTLATNVLASSLTSLGTIAALLAGTINASGKITATTAGIDVPVSALGTSYSAPHTPTLSGATNVASSTMRDAIMKRVGNRVDVDGRVDITPSAGGGVAFLLTIPVASNFTNAFDLTGLMSGNTATYGGSLVSANIANDKAQFDFVVPDATLLFVAYHYSYIVK